MKNVIQGKDRHLIYNLYLNKFQHPRQKSKNNNLSPYSLSSSIISQQQKIFPYSTCLNQKNQESKKQSNKINLIYINQMFQNKFRSDSYESFKGTNKLKNSDNKNVPKKVRKIRCLSAGIQGRIKSSRNYFNLDLKNKLTCSSINTKKISNISKENTVPITPLQSKKTFRSQELKTKRDRNTIGSYRKHIKTQKTARVQKPNPDLQIKPWKVIDIDEF